jgi:autotransporter-associated beta strand protein
LVNVVTLRGGTNLSVKAKAEISGFSPDDKLTLAGSVVVEAEGSSADVSLPTNMALNLLTPVELTNTLSVAGTLSLTGGSSLSFLPEMASLYLGDFVLQDGTLNIGLDATQSGIAINGTTGNRRISLLDNDVTISAGDGTILPIWESAFSFSGGNKTLKIESGSFGVSAVAIKNTVAISVEDGTLSLGGVQRAPGATSGIISKSGAGTLEFNSSIASAGSLALTELRFLGGTVAFSSLSPVVFSGTTQLSTATVQITPGGSLTLSGPVNGTGFTKTGAGALTIEGANTISGATTISAGPLSLASGAGALRLGDAATGALDAPTLVSTGTVSGAITVGSGATSAYTAVLASSGTGTATFSGSVTLSTGSASFVLQAADGGTLNLSGSWAANNKPVTVGAPGKAGTVRLSSALSTSGGILVKNGSLLLGGSNTLGTSPLTLDGGSLNLSTFTTTAGAVTLTSGDIHGSGTLNAASITAQSGSIYATLTGNGALTKTGAGNVTIAKASGFTGSTTVSAGTLTSALLSSTAPITVDANATYKLALSTGGTYTGTLNNNGTLSLTSGDEVVLTLGTTARLSGSIEIGPKVTLKADAGANNLFATDFRLTLNGGKFDANGTTQTITNITTSSGGSLYSSASAAGTITTTSTVSLLNYGNITFPTQRKTEVIEPGTLKFTAGSLGNLASGGTVTYSEVITEAESQNATLTFDQAVTASTSVTARVSSGSAYTLSVGSLVTTPLFDVQKNVTVVFATNGQLEGGLRIGGTVSLSGLSKPFSAIELQDGSLTTGTLFSGSLTESGTTASVLSATLGSGFVSLTKTGSGTLTISGANTDYLGSLSASAGTVILGNAAALGAAPRIASLGADATLRLSGNSLTLSTLSGAGTIENGSLQAVTLTLPTATDSTFTGVIRDGTPSAALSLIKDGASTVTLGGTSTYTGSTTVKQGQLLLVDGRLPSGTALTIQGGTLGLGTQSLSVSSYAQTAGVLQDGTVTLNVGTYLLSGGTVSAVLAGTAPVNVTGNVTLNGAATYSGTTTVTNGSLQLAAGGALPAGTSLDLLGGTLALGGKAQTVAAYSQSGGSVFDGTVTLDTGSFNLTGGSVSAVLAGSAAAAVSGGVITLNAVATYSGSTTVTGGQLQLGSAGALPAGTVNLLGGTLALGGRAQGVAAYNQSGGTLENGTVTLDIGSFNLTGGTVSAVLAGAAGAAVSGGVTTLDRAATYSGPTVLTSGKLQYAPNGSLATTGALTVQGGTLALATKNQTLAAYTQTSGSVENGTVTLNAGSFNLNGGSVTAALAGSAGAVVGGNVTLNTQATYAGSTAINTGKLLLAQSGALPTSTALTVAQGGTFNLGGRSQTVGAVVLNGGLVEAGTLTGTSYTFGGGTVSASLAGTGSASVTGAVTLSAANTFSGVTTLSGGAQLTVANTAALANSLVDYGSGAIAFASGVNAATFGGLTGSQNLALTNASNGAVALTVSASTDATYSGLLSGNGSFTKAGAGNLTLGQAPSDLVAMTVSAGSLTLANGDLLNGSRSITNEGTINLNLSTGLTYNGTLGGSGTINLNSLTPVTLALGTNARLSGNIVLNNVTLDLSSKDYFLASGSTLNIGTGASVLLGSGTQEITSLVMNGGSLRGLAGSKVLYGSLTPTNLLNVEGTNPRTDFLNADAIIAFEVSSKTFPLPATGTQTGLLVTAGRAGSGANGLQLLRLQPETDTTKVIIDQPLTLSAGIEAILGAGRSKGLISIENQLTLTLPGGSITFAQGIEATLTQSGSLNAAALQNDGLLIVDVSAAKTVEIPINGTGSLKKAGAGTATLKGNNTYTGGTTLSEGVLELGSENALGGTGAISFTGGTLGYGVNMTRDLSARIAALASGTVAGIDTGANKVTFASGLTGTGGIAKLGAGTLVLTGSNSFSGAVAVKVGTLQIGGGASAGSLAAAAAVDSGAVLRFARSGELTYSGALSGEGTLQQDGAGTLKVDGANSNFEGTIRISQGTLTLASETASGGAAASLVFDGGTLQFGTDITTDVSAKIAELGSGVTARIDTGGNTVTFNTGLSGAGGLQKLGVGTLELQVANDFAGPTTVTAGLLRAGTALGSTSAITVNGGSFEARSYNPAAALTIGANGTAYFPEDGPFTAGTIVNTGRLNFAGNASDVTVGSLTGTGFATFANDATISTGITVGSITVGGDLVTPSISNGTVSAAKIEGPNQGRVSVSGGLINIEGTVTSMVGTVSGGSLTFVAPVDVEAITGGSITANRIASFGTVSGGVITLQSATSDIDVLNGGTIVNGSVLTVLSGTMGGSISGVGSLTKTGSGNLTLTGATTYEGSTDVFEGTLSVGGAATLFNSAGLVVHDGAQANFTASPGTITLKGLSGGGTTTFASNATLSGGSVFEGSVNVSGRLTADVSGGTVTAASLTAGTVSGGELSLTSGVSTVGRLTNGSINIAGAASLSVSTGTFGGLLTGSGTLNKTGASNLDLSATPEETLSVNVQAGTLNVENLLTGNRSVSVSTGGQLNTTITEGTYAGQLTGTGSTLLGGTGTLTLGAAGFIQGSLTLDTGVTLDVSSAGNTGAAANAGVSPATSLTLLTGSRLTLNAPNQRLELQSLTLTDGAILNAESGVILYDSAPVYLSGGSSAQILDLNNDLLDAYKTLVLITGSLKFEENSKQEPTGITGTYKFVAGRVKDVVDGAQRLLLNPQDGKTVRISSALVPIAQEIVATGTGSGGFVSVGTLVTTPRFAIGAGIQATFTQDGALSSNGVFVNNGTLQFSVLSGNTKPVGNQISGAGVLEKLDGGTLELSAANTYSGATRLSGGVLQLNNSAAIGTGTAAIVFNGGGLRYGPGITTDLSGRFAVVGAGTVAIDTGANAVTFASPVSGSGGLAKSGTGTLVLAAANTFTGELSVGAGTLKVGNGVAGSLAAASADVSSGALLSFARNDSITYGGAITGAGRVEQAGNGTLLLTGDGTGFTGTFELSGGTTLVGSSGALAAGTVTFNGGTLKYAINQATDLSSRINPLTKTALLDTGSYDVVYGTGLSGTAGLTKHGVGTLTLSGANTYTGLTAVAAGTLRYSGAGLTSAGTVSTQTNTTVLLEHTGPAVVFTGAVTGPGQLLKNGSGTVTIEKSQANTGGVTLNGGSLVLSNAAILGGTVALNTGSTLDLILGSLNANTALAFNGGNLRLGDESITVTSLTLNAGSILYAGTADSTNVFYSTLTGAGVNVPEAVTLLKYAENADGSPAVLSGSLKGTISSLPNTSDLTVTPNQNGKLLTLAVANGLNLGTFKGEVGVNLSITKPVNVTGDFLLRGGTVQISDRLNSSNGSVVFGMVSGGTSSAVTGTINSGGSIGAREFTLTGTSVLTLNDTSALENVTTLQVGARTSASSAEDRANDATLIIPAGTLSLVRGQTLKGSGRILGDVTLAQDAVLDPGNSPGTLYFAGTLNLTSGTIRIEVGNLTAGTLVQDRIDVGSLGSVVIGGTGATAGLRPTFQIVDTDGALASGGTLQDIISGSLGFTLTVNNAGTFTFARQSSTGAVLPSVMYTSNDSLAALRVNRLQFASFAGPSQNLTSFAKALDTRILTQRATADGLLELGTGIANTDAVATQLAAALPVAYSELAALSTQRTLNLHQGLVGRFSSVRANLLEVPEGAFSAWTTGYGAGHRQDGNRSLGTAGFTASSWGDMTGVEQRIGSLLLGITGAAGRTTASFANNPGRATTDSWHGGLYGALDLEGFVIESGVMYGATDTRARRTISAPGLTTREGRVTLSGSEWMANLGVAKPIAASDALTITPSVRVIAQGQSQGAARESDLSGLEVGLAKQRTSTLQHQAGMEIRRKLKLAGLPAAASLQLDWIHNYSAKGRNLNMALSGDPSASYAYKGSDAGADSIHIGAAFEAALSQRVTLRLGGEYQSQTGLSTVRGTASIGYQF